jgi:hypothetical protein
VGASRPLVLATEPEPDDRSVALADPLAARVLEANDVVFRAAQQDPALVGMGCALAALRRRCWQVDRWLRSRSSGASIEVSSRAR